VLWSGNGLLLGYIIMIVLILRFLIVNSGTLIIVKRYKLCEADTEELLVWGYVEG